MENSTPINPAKSAIKIILACVLCFHLTSCEDNDPQINELQFKVDENQQRILIEDNSVLNGIEIIIPDGIFNEGEKIIVEKSSNNISTGNSMSEVTEIVFDIKTESGKNQFSKPIEIVIPYKTIDVENGEYPLVGYFNDVNESWGYITNIEFNESDKTLKFKTRHFSVFSLIVIKFINDIHDEINNILMKNGLGKEFFKTIIEEIDENNCSQLFDLRESLIYARNYSYNGIIGASEKYQDCKDLERTGFGGSIKPCEFLYGDFNSLQEYFLVKTIDLPLSDYEIFLEYLKSIPGLERAVKLWTIVFEGGLAIDCISCFLDNSLVAPKVISHYYISLLINQTLKKIDTKLLELECGQEGIIADYPFNGNANDESGNGYDGTVNGASLTFDRFGNPNSAYIFDGNDNIALGDILDDVFTGNNKFSISLWFEINDLSKAVSLLGKSSNTNCGEGQRQFSLNYEPSINKIVFRYSTKDKSNLREVQIADQIEKNKIYHAVLTYDGSLDSNNGLDRVNFYLDGINTGENLGSSIGGFPFDIQEGSAHLGIGNLLNSSGGNCNPNGFKGIIDDVKIFNYLLQDNEITDLFTEGGWPIDTGLIAYYPFNGNALDASGNNHTGIVNGPVLTTDRKGQANRAYSFDGIDDLISIEHSADLNPGQNAFSISGWFKTTMTTFGNVIAKSNQSERTRNFYQFNIYSNVEVQAEIGVVQDGIQIKAAGSRNDGNWHHFVMIRSPIGTYDSLVLFIDGVQVDNGKSNTLFDISPADEVTIGAIVDYDGSGITNYFKGEIDDIRIYNYAISNSKVSELYIE
ncbi:LamG domain-containing protein [Fulvivirgaceae bacterium BMA10]|uniref:LamG domain-containing protein n=1 Tax=Splendidivirga corallicola TaxID=3051826 RepID=A0ABT8KGY9_9BACT|nr:LamG domain-containing protein [Fulvivirgaceae bacterium BMA10]